MQNKTKNMLLNKTDLPILTIGGEAGFGNLTTTSFQKFANNVTGITLPKIGHFIPSERPNFVTKQILEFFRQHFFCCGFCFILYGRTICLE